VPHVVGRGRIVTTGEQCPGAVEEWLPAGDDELVADVADEAARPARRLDVIVCGWFPAPVMRASVQGALRSE
jgi:hypothetical protein